MRLIDKIKHDGYWSVSDDAPAEWRPPPFDPATCAVFQIDNIVQWLGTTHGGATLHATDLPSCAAPRDSMWMEMADGALGFHVRSTRDDVRWRLEMEPFGWMSGRVIQGLSTMFVHLDDRGRPLEWGYTAGSPDNGEAVTLGIGCLWALAFLNTKNVVTAEAHASRAEQRRCQRAYGEPMHRTQTITLQVPRKGGGGSSSGDGSAHALHIVDGHFAHFGDCCPGVHEPKGLAFVKLEGVYWVPSHARGNPERGSITNDRILTINDGG